MIDEDAVRAHATAFCDALDSGDVEAASSHLSQELQRNLGEVVALLPLPTNESSVVSVDRGGSGFDVVLRLVGETEEIDLQTRWKDRDGEATLVEASHLSRAARQAQEPQDADADADAAEG